MAHPQDRLLQKPLYLFDLPEELLYSLQLRSLPTQSLETSLHPHLAISGSPSAIESIKEDSGPTSATACALCGLTFSNLQDQRSHVRSDLHGYNLKQKLRGKKPVGEAEFERLVGQLDESISGSDSEDSEEDSDEPNGAPKAKESTLSALLKRQAKLADGDGEDTPVSKKQRGSGKPPLLWFSSPKLPSNTSLGAYRAVFSPAEQAHEETLVETIQQKQLAAKPPPPPRLPKASSEEDIGVPTLLSVVQNDTSASGPHYFLCMIGGGHFAAMVVSLTPKLTKRAGVEDRSATVIAHKTFHRYTTRRKQGGSQSANDNSKGNAHSAGSSLRRYNETALVEEVRALLQDWKALIDSAQLLFVRATGSTNRRTLFGPYDGQVLLHKDERLRGFPFNTRRATQSELMRAFVELTRVKVSVVDEAALAKEAAKANAAAHASKVEATTNDRPSPGKQAKPSKADEEASLHTTQLQGLIRRSKGPGMLSYIRSNDLNPNFSFFPPEQNHHAPTPLHLAAASNSPACVGSLLVKGGADPGIRNADGKSAFEVAGDRATRDAFRLARSHLGETCWPWDAAGVPSALSPAEAEARTAREKEEQAAEDAKEKQRRQKETERLRQLDRDTSNGRDLSAQRGHVLGKPTLTAEERRAEQSRGMSDEMRMRLEREKRARAAEERMKRLQGR